MSLLSAERPRLEPLRPGVARRTVARIGLAVLTAAAVVLLMVRERAMLEAGSDSIARADLLWLAAAAVGTVLLWTAGTVSQLGSIPARVPVLRLFAVQFAGTFANHVVPAGVGGAAVNIRFLCRRGVPRATAAGAVGLNIAAGAVTHTALLVIAVLLAPASLTKAFTQGGPLLSGLVAHLRGAGPLIVAAAVLLAVAAVWWTHRIAPSARGRWTRLVARVTEQLAVLLAVLRTPVRAAQLWLGSIAVPVLHCLILYAVLRSLGGTAPALEVSVAYLIASVGVVPAALPRRLRLARHRPGGRPHRRRRAGCCSAGHRAGLPASHRLGTAAARRLRLGHPPARQGDLNPR